MKELLLKLSLVLLICALTFTISGCIFDNQNQGNPDNGGDTHTHQYTEEITKAPTCSEEGEKTFTCSCNDSYTEAIEKLPHTEEAIPAVAPTCTATGLTEGKKCSVCNEIIKAQETAPATGHTGSEAVKENFVDSTCSTAGSYDSVVYCSVCNAEVSREAVAVEKKAHTEVIDAAVEPTCTEPGKTEGKYCLVCGEVITAQTVVDALGHKHSDEWKISDTQHWHECHCGDKADLADHSFDDAIDATCDCGFTREVAPTVSSDEVVKEYDIFDLANKESIVLNFAENVSNHSGLELTYSAKLGDEALTLDGALYTFAFGEYTDATVYEYFTVTVSCLVNGVQTSVQYTYKLGLKDTSDYRVANGNFENGLEGWELNNTLGDAPFAGIDEKSTFWGEGYPMFNVGKYFSSYADGASEGSQGTLASPYFLANSEFATYMLGGAGNPNVYITIENKAGEVLALYRNTKFADLPAGDYSVDDYRAMIGNTVFLANFVTYKVDISAFAGQEIRFVVHDYASSGWGVVYFDELNTYYESADAVSESAVLAENLLANKDNLNAEIALEITEQGDYTLDSFNAYADLLAEAKAIAGDIAASQVNVDRITAALSKARNALAIRPIEEVEGANKSFSIISGDNKEIVISDYINVNGLNNISYEITVGDCVTVSDIIDGRFTITAGTVSEATSTCVTIKVIHNGYEKLTVDLTVNITNDLAPTLFSDVVIKEIDIFYLANKHNIVLDLSENVDNSGKLDLTYHHNGGMIDGTLYTYNLGDYSENAVCESFTVDIYYMANGEFNSISYTYTLYIKDTTENRLENGGFENDLEGWTEVGHIGGISSDTHYWVNDPEVPSGFEFGLEGNKMYSAYAPGAFESAVGTLTSSSFKVGGSGFVTFKLGAMRDGNYVYVDVVDAETKQILARYYNGLWAEYTDGLKSGCTMIAYKADLSAFAGREVFFRISDNADSGYGLFFVDSFVTYYESEPEGFNLATPVDYEIGGTIYDVFNGGFEMGNVQGWWNNGEIGVVTNANGYWGDNIPYEKVGDFLFTGVESFGADTMREGNRGVLTSSVFEIGGTGFISFKLGGGGSDLCYVQVIDAVTGEVLARYHQQAQQDAKLIQYVAKLDAHIGRTVRIQVVDQADSGWGCVSFDNVVTYYPVGAALPEGIEAIDIKDNLKYTIDNGSFESGNIDGWTMNITEAGAHNTLGWVESSEHDAGWYTKNDDIKDGSFLLTFAKPDGTNCENTKGNLQSSTFSLKQGSFVAFKFGGAGGGSNHDVYIELCRADGSVIARFFNDAPGKVNTRMNAYYYQYNGPEVNCFFRVVDNSTGDYGCFVVDDFRVNLNYAPEGFIPAIQ